MKFTTAGSDGRFGPSQSDVDSEYSGTELDGEVSVIGDGIQVWTVPNSGSYEIECRGAGTGYTSNQAGAVVKSEIQLEAGDTLRLLVGQEPQSSEPFRSGSGGSFVARETSSGDTMFDGQGVELLLAAGGSGGVTSSSDGSGVRGRASDPAFDSSQASGGSGGSGGGQGGSCFAQSGAGYSGNGDGCDGDNAVSFLGGGVGGSGGGPSEGGFGGGSTGRTNSNWRLGGGGGYSGGASAGNSSSDWGSGGSSFVTGDVLEAEDGAHTGPGEITIKSSKAGASTNPATNVEADSATLNTSVGLAEESSVDVWFEYGELTEGFTEQTTPTTITENGSYSESVSELEPVTHYQFRAVMQDSVGITESSILEFITLSSSPVRLSWDDTTDSSNPSDGFNIYRSTESSPSFPADYTQITDVDAPTETYDDLYAPVDETVTYAVTAYNGAGESDPANSSITTPPHDSEPAPGGPELATASTTSVAATTVLSTATTASQSEASMAPAVAAGVDASTISHAMVESSPVGSQAGFVSSDGFTASIASSQLTHSASSPISGVGLTSAVVLSTGSTVLVEALSKPSQAVTKAESVSSRTGSVGLINSGKGVAGAISGSTVAPALGLTVKPETISSGVAVGDVPRASTFVRGAGALSQAISGSNLVESVAEPRVALIIDEFGEVALATVTPASGSIAQSGVTSETAAISSVPEGGGSPIQGSSVTQAIVSSSPIDSIAHPTIPFIKGETDVVSKTTPVSSFGTPLLGRGSSLLLGSAETASIDPEISISSVYAEATSSTDVVDVNLSHIDPVVFTEAVGVSDETLTIAFPTVASQPRLDLAFSQIVSASISPRRATKEITRRTGRPGTFNTANLVNPGDENNSAEIQ